ncbi:cytochrome P450 [Amycolatopsis sp. NPDC059021]|uniref:cytochrome P450 n=1 Tax=Amycolatopsis sp. NPDC059021 TaxID=3346704 RepID=UPI00366CE599
MVAVAGIRGAHPSQFWLREEKPADVVALDPVTKVWGVYGHAESLQVLNAPATFSSEVQRKVAVDERLNVANLLQMDGAPHTRLRKMVSRVFTPKSVTGLEPRIVELTGELLDRVAGHDKFDMVEDLAYPLPLIVIAELLGVPGEDRPLFQQWVDMMFRDHKEISLAETEEGKAPQANLGGAAEVLRYVSEHVAERRVRPRDDLLTRLVETEVDGERLTDAEVVNFGFVLLLSGYVTTTMLLGNAVLCLDAFPEWQARTRADRSLIPGVIEESLRMLPPFTAVSRVTTEDVELGGQHIPADEMVMVWLAAANRDERVFRDPHTFDPARDPNHHLSFGRGIHFCLGAPLARAEGRIALNMLLDRFPHLRTDPEDGPTFRDIAIMTGVDRLPLLITPEY